MANRFRSLKEKFWNINPDDTKRVIAVCFLKGFISSIFCILHDLKDAVIIGANRSCAEVIPVLKGVIVLPISILFFILYSKLRDNFKPTTVFISIMIFFFISFSLFSFVLFPYESLITPEESINTLYEIFGKENCHWIAVERFRMLVTKAAKINSSSFKIRNKKGKTSFLVACEKDRGITILNSNLKDNIKEDLINTSDNDNNSCIHILAQFNGEKTLEHINEEYENLIKSLVQKENSNNSNPLHLCGGSKKNTEIILNRLLEANKSKINNTNKDGDAPIHCMVKALKKPYEPENQSDLSRVGELHPALLSLKLIGKKADTSVRNGSGQTALQLLESLESEIIDKHNSKNLITNCKSAL